MLRKCYDASGDELLQQVRYLTSRGPGQACRRHRAGALHLVYARAGELESCELDTRAGELGAEKVRC